MTVIDVRRRRERAGGAQGEGAAGRDAGMSEPNEFEFIDSLTREQRRFYLRHDEEQSYDIATAHDRIAELEAEVSRLRAAKELFSSTSRMLGGDNARLRALLGTAGEALREIEKNIKPILESSRSTQEKMTLIVTNAALAALREEKGDDNATTDD